MAGYDYTNRGYTTNNGMKPRTDGWSKTSNADDGSCDHLCRPVAVDAEGRKHPIISYTPNHSTESYVTKIETIVEHVQIPMVTHEYKYSLPKKVEPAKEYGFGNNKWGRPLGSSVHDRPQKVEEFISEIQTEVSRPTRTTPSNPTYWRQSPNSTGGYIEPDYGNKEWNKPSGNSFRDETLMEPAMVTSGTWARPNRSPWGAPAAINGTPLGKPTNDIGEAVEYLKEAVTKPSSVTPAPAFPQPRFTVTVPRRETATVLPRRDAYSETIDSREAARRYSNFNGSSQPYTTGDPYGTTISSRDAMKKYNGTIV